MPSQGGLERLDGLAETGSFCPRALDYDTNNSSFRPFDGPIRACIDSQIRAKRFARFAL